MSTNSIFPSLLNDRQVRESSRAGGTTDGPPPKKAAASPERAAAVAPASLARAAAVTADGLLLKKAGATTGGPHPKRAAGSLARAAAALVDPASLARATVAVVTAGISLSHHGKASGFGNQSPRSQKESLARDPASLARDPASPARGLASLARAKSPHQPGRQANGLPQKKTAGPPLKRAVASQARVVLASLERVAVVDLESLERERRKHPRSLGAHHRPGEENTRNPKASLARDQRGLANQGRDQKAKRSNMSG